jgi:hypothetical protein
MEICNIVKALAPALDQRLVVLGHFYEKETVDWFRIGSTKLTMLLANFRGSHDDTVLELTI